MWNIPTNFTVTNIRHKPFTTVAFLQSTVLPGQDIHHLGNQVSPYTAYSSSSSSSSLTYRKSALLFRPKSAQSKRLAFCFYTETEILPSTTNPPHFIVPNISNLLIWTNFCVMSKPDTKIFSRFCIRFHVYPIFCALLFLSFFLTYFFSHSVFLPSSNNKHPRAFKNIDEG